MWTHRFGRKIKLPATIAIKHQISMLMAQDIKKAELEAAIRSSSPHAESGVYRNPFNVPDSEHRQAR